MRKSRIAVAFAGLIALVVLTSSAGASHSWENFHWARAANPATLEVVDSVVGEWDSYLTPAVADWNRSSVVELNVTPGGDSVVERTACLPISGKIRVCNAKYADPTWLGLATVWLDGDHIRQATAQVNDTWFDTEFYNDPNAKRHVLCQEVGHDFGLDHTYTEPTCMDDVNGLFDPAFVSPGSHDYEQLDAIYAHLDGASGGGKGAKGGPKGGGGKNHSGDCNGGSCGSTIRVWEEGDLTVVQYVLLAPATS
ncbi:MAG: hypothetical protein M3323_03795 [Actinomycetota bacterium]|nr:hypothetical protein [Actinomycetota bacterium]